MIKQHNHKPSDEHDEYMWKYKNKGKNTTTIINVKMTSKVK